MPRRLVPAAALLFVIATLGCDEPKKKPPKQPNPPRRVEGSINAICRPVEGTYIFSEFEATIEDQDGVATLEQPVITVESTRLTPTSTEDHTVVPDGGLTKEAEEIGPTQITYRWVYDPTGDGGTERIYCGENGDALQVRFRVYDEDGFKVELVALTRPQ